MRRDVSLFFRRRDLSVIAVVAVLMAAVVSAEDPDLLSPEAFSRRCADKITAAVTGASVEVPSPLVLHVKHPKSGESTVHLEAAYETYRKAPKTLDEILAAYASGMLEAVPNAGGIDQSRIVPIVQARSWLAEVGATPGKPPPVVYDVLNPDLIVVYAENTPNSLSYFSPSELEAAKIDRDGLRQLAANNLVRILPQIERRGDNGVYAVVAGGEFETSLLAVGTGWRKESFDVEGEFVFAAPARGTLFVTGSKDAEGLEKVRAMAKTAYGQSSQKLSPKLFVQRGGQLVELPGAGSRESGAESRGSGAESRE
jgi:uncharacterized protein YtpQ (UPF0354 family)